MVDTLMDIFGYHRVENNMEKSTSELLRNYVLGYVEFENRGEIVQELEKRGVDIRIVFTEVEVLLENIGNKIDWERKRFQ